MSNLEILMTELANDPEGRGYISMNAEQIRQSMIQEREGSDPVVLSKEEFTQLIDWNEVGAISNDQKRSTLQMILSLDIVDFSNPTVETALASIFGPGPTKNAVLAATQPDSLPDWQRIGLSRRPRVGWIETAMMELGWSV